MCPTQTDVFCIFLSVAERIENIAKLYHITQYYVRIVLFKGV